MTRLVNAMDPHAPPPFHLHGADRFLMLARDVVAEPNLVLRDIVLVRDLGRRRLATGTR